jgi:ribonuclease H / adenosylcobalamin/alpha-ribazole phosphatase
VTAWGPATGEPTVTLLLRHGQTPYSTERRFAGRADIGLTTVGEQQAAAAATRLGKLGRVDAVVSSPLSRARLTAGAVADACGAEVAVEEGFAETDFGDWDGLTFAEASERDPAVLEAWLASSAAAPPGGESFVAVRERVLAGLSRLLAANQGRTVVVVSHVTPIKILLAHALEAPLSSLYRMFLDTASLSRIDWYPDGPAVVRSLNDTAHLA